MQYKSNHKNSKPRKYMDPKTYYQTMCQIKESMDYINTNKISENVIPRVMAANLLSNKKESKLLRKNLAKIQKESNKKRKSTPSDINKIEELILFEGIGFTGLERIFNEKQLTILINTIIKNARFDLIESLMIGLSNNTDPEDNTPWNSFFYFIDLLSNNKLLSVLSNTYQYKSPLDLYPDCQTLTEYLRASTELDWDDPVVLIDSFFGRNTMKPWKTASIYCEKMRKYEKKHDNGSFIEYMDTIYDKFGVGKIARKGRRSKTLAKRKK